MDTKYRERNTAQLGGKYCTEGDTRIQTVPGRRYGTKRYRQRYSGNERRYRQYNGYYGYRAGEESQCNRRGYPDTEEGDREYRGYRRYIGRGYRKERDTIKIEQKKKRRKTADELWLQWIQKKKTESLDKTGEIEMSENAEK